MSHVPTLVFRFVVQRVSMGEVVINNQSCGRIAKGLVVLVGIGEKDAPATAVDVDVVHLQKRFKPLMDKALDKLFALRIFEDDAQKMNLSLTDVKGGLYLVSQFTLFADVRKGNRPSFTNAAKPAVAKPLFDDLVLIAKQKALSHDFNVFTGEFGADMKVSLLNDGPVTILFEATEADGISGL